MTRYSSNDMIYRRLIYVGVTTSGKALIVREPGSQVAKFLPLSQIEFDGPHLYGHSLEVGIPGWLDEKTFDSEPDDDEELIERD